MFHGIFGMRCLFLRSLHLSLHRSIYPETNDEWVTGEVRFSARARGWICVSHQGLSQPSQQISQISWALVLVEGFGVTRMGHPSIRCPYLGVEEKNITASTCLEKTVRGCWVEDWADRSSLRHSTSYMLLGFTRSFGMI